MGVPSKFDYYFSPQRLKKMTSRRQVVSESMSPSLAPGAPQYSFKIYLFYENWSTETFRNGGLKKWADWSIPLHFKIAL
jgi:hypothetical protein